MGFGLLSYSREPLLEGADIPENSVKATGQETLGGLLAEAKCKCCANCPECDCPDCKVDKDFKQGGPGDDFALGYPMQSSTEAAEQEQNWQPWEIPQPPSPLDEFRKLSGLATDDAGYLPSPMSTGNRNVYSTQGVGILDYAPVAEEFIGEADPESSKAAPERSKPLRTGGAADRSRKDSVPKAGKEMRAEMAAMVRKLKAKYGLPRDTGWKAPPAPKPEPTEG